MARFIVFVFFIGLSELTIAEPLETSNKARIQDLSSAQNRLLTGWRLDSYTYEEPSLMKESGFFTGPEVNYQTNDFKGLGYFEIQGAYLFGNVRYKGSVTNLDTNESTPYSTTESQQVWEARGLWLMASRTPGERNFLPLVGISYRQLIDPKEGEFDYRREISYLTFPVGFRVTLLPEVNRNVNLTLMIDTLIEGRAKTWASQIDPEYTDLNQKQKGGYGWKLIIDGSFLVGPRSVFYASAFLQKWDINASETTEETDSSGTRFYFYEPANNTLIYGISGGVIF